MDNTSVRITIGNERTTVVETKDYKNSIFEEQYKHALHEVVNYLRNDFTDVSQIIAFCGDRGEGKTSCMLSFSNLINNVYSNSEYIKNILDSSDFNLLSQEKFLSFPLLDPSYFEKEYSVLEYLTGLIYNYIIKSQIDNGTRAYHNVLRSLQDVKRGLHNLHKRVEDRFDPLDEIGALALGLNLKESLKYLIRNILSLYEKSRLVLLLDDIDLNMEGAYSMVEQIRKYLCIPECIILTSVNLDQLQTAIAVSIQKNSLIDTSFDSEKVAEEMARKYIDKLIPASARINMPKVDALCERPLVIVDRLGNTIYNNSLVKDGVVELIFQKTRYLFYNSKGGVSRVVPNNLRELMHLVGLLAEMPYVGEKRENLRSNQREFKDYFFKIWTQKLPSAFLPDISDWINSPLDNALNKNIIDFFSTNEYFEQYLQKDFSEHSEEGRKEEETVSNSHYVNGSVYYHSSNSLLNNRNSSENPNNHIDSILSSYNFSYNISVGDVFFVINCLEKDYLGEDAEKMLFFIKSFYSMRLYEDYDIITENKGQIYPSDDNVRGIYRSDDRFLHTNVLQRLVNGSYFTYSPGELIAYNPSNDAPIDQRTILGFRFNKYDIDNNTGLNKLIKEVKDTWKKFDTIDEEKKKEVISKLRLVEFFFLSITHSISSRTRAELGKASYIEKYQCQCRANVLPVAFSEFNGLTGYYVFDVLAPFANIINPEYCYCRFQYGREIFEIACSCEKSLLYSLVEQARIGRGEDKGKVSNEIHEKLQVITDDISPKEVFYSLSHHLQSDAIIRNAEILAAFFEDCKLARNKRSKNQASGGSGIIKILESFYKSLIYPEDRAMSTHSRSKAEDGKPHKIRFGFLNSFVELLDQIDKKDSVLMNCFHEIFNPSFGLTDFEKKLRLFYLMSIPDDKGKKYSANNLVKIIASKYPKLESNLQEIFNNESSRTSKTPSDWYSYLLKNKAIDNVLDNSVFNVISSNISSEIITKSLESILSSTQSDSKEE